MTEQEIIDGNKLIAEFMGYIHHLPEDNQDEHYWHSPNKVTCDFVRSGNWFFEDPPPFYKAWEWLMPVLTKLSDIDERYVGWKIESCECCIWTDDDINNYDQTFQEETTILSVWCAVVDFIKWHNQNSPQPQAKQPTRPNPNLTSERN